MKVTLSRPFASVLALGDTPETVIGEVELAFDRLTGNDVRMASTEALAEDSEAVSFVIGTTAQAQFAAIASGLPVETIRRMPAKDYAEIVGEVRRYLFAREGVDPIALNVDGLTGLDIEAASRGVVQSDPNPKRIGLNLDAVEMLVVRCSNVSAEALRALPARQYLLAVLAVQGFLLGTG